MTDAVSESGASGETKLLLTEREAFIVMSEFIWQFASRAGDDLLTLIGDTDLAPDGGSSDPSALDDWHACVLHVRAGLPLRANNDGITRTVYKTQ